MPFINGRYYINPVMGGALEAARETDAPPEDRAHEDAGPDNAIGDPSGQNMKREEPIHRVEIEAAELVPAHSGRASRGFVARIHRQPPNPAPGGQGMLRLHSLGTGHVEMHVFSDHRDLVSFLEDELRKDAHSHHAS